MKHQQVQQQQGNLNAQAQGDLALGQITVTAGTPAFAVQRGFLDAITDNGVGDYSVTMTNAQAVNTAGIVLATVSGATPGTATVEAVSATVLRVRCFNLANPPAAADLNVWLRVTPISPT